MPELLLELLSEEIPARMQARAAEDLKRLVCERLDKAQLTYQRADAFVTPRRLALVVDGLPERQPDVVEERKGPRVGSPAKAIEGFLRAAGLASIDQAEVRDIDKGQFYFAAWTRPGAATTEVLTSLLPGVVWSFPWPKSMRWGDGKLRWIRPLQSLVCLFNGAVVLVELQPQSFDAIASFDDIPSTDDVGAGPQHGISVGAKTRGHRFLASAKFEVRDFADYRDKLRAAKVMLDPAERRALIAADAQRLATAEGLAVRDDPALLDEVTGLVEWPVVMLGSIDPKFMDVPAEVLITAMRAHQKYFSLLDASGRLAPRFVLVANTEAADGGRAIVAGNERVLRARLSDAKFFWDEDRKRTLESRVPKLAERVFHARLGSDLQRSERLAKLARELVQFHSRCDGAHPKLAERAARLCKADLTTRMVGEFPELQGVMGSYYALRDKVLPDEHPDVAEAIGWHYKPQGPHDTIPATPAAVAVALADKIDTLAGFFAIGEKPTGSKDPFALRRAALGVIRIVTENEPRLRLNLRPLFLAALAAYPEAVAGGRAPAVADDLLTFLADRLKVHLREQGVRHDLIAAVFAGGAEDDLVRLLSRVDALRDFLASDDGANLLVAYRRASNIVRIEENKDNRLYEGEADETLLAEKQEIELHQALATARVGVAGALACERFGEAMTILAGLRAPVDAFFDHVQVNCPDAQVRVNRLRLLSQIRSALGGVADFSQIEG